VHEDRTRGEIFEDREDLGRFGFGRRGEAAHGDVDILHTRGGYEFLFGEGTAIAFAKVDYGSDPEAGKVAETFIGRLGAAINVLIDLMEVVDTGNG
jgi:hypothetical protein